MRLLLVDNEFPPKPHGGIGAYDLLLARTLSRLGHFVCVLTGTDESRVSICEQEYGILVKAPYRSLKAGLGKYFRWLEALSFGFRILPVAKRLISEFQIGIVEIPSSSGYGSPLAKVLQARVPVITRFHGSQGKIPIDATVYPLLEGEIRRMGGRMTRTRVAGMLNSPQWSLERQQIASSAYVTCPSYFARRWVKANIGCSDRKLSVIPNGVSLQDFVPFREYGCPQKNDRRLACFVGRISIPKGASVLARALPLILDSDDRADVMLAGPRLDAGISIQLDILSERYPGRLIMPGRLPREQLLQKLARAHCLVHPAFYEISPMAVLEAMTLGVPVAASRTGPHPEMVDELETGLLFQPGDEVSLAESVLTLLSSSRMELVKMGEKAIKVVENRFNLDTLVSQIVELYAAF